MPINQLYTSPTFYKGETEWFHLGKSHLQKPQVRHGCPSPKAAVLLGLPEDLPQAALPIFLPPPPLSSHLFCTLETPPIRWLPLKGRAWGKSCSKIQEKIRLFTNTTKIVHMHEVTGLTLLTAHLLAAPRMAHMPFIPCHILNVPSQVQNSWISLCKASSLQEELSLMSFSFCGSYRWLSVKFQWFQP